MKGVKAALGRLMDGSIVTVERVVDRWVYTEVKDDLAAVILLEQLPMKVINHHGESHENAKLNDDQVWEIRRRAAEVRNSKCWPMNLASTPP